MKKGIGVFLAACLLAALLVACGGDQAGEPESGGDANAAPVEPPPEYQGKTNPFDEEDEQSAAAGESLYQTNCASCHGPQGGGDGPAASSLNPKPTNLAQREEGLSDSYLFWRISEGGAMDPFNSAMPPWAGILDQNEIWQVITHIRVQGE